MAYTTINKSSEHFNTKLYTGTGNDNLAITGIGFQPDWIWAKDRDGTDAHHVADAVNGAGYRLRTNTTGVLGTQADGVKSFDSDGFTVGTTGSINTNGHNFVAWNWKANGAGSANTDGSINSTVSANATAGFSIIKYTGNGTGNSTIGHGLGATPKFIIVKNLTTAQSWGTKSDSFVSAGDPRVLYLNATASYANDTNVWGTSAVFNNSTFTVGDWNGSNQSGSSFIAYCFAQKTGYSKFGSYIGNDLADGTFVYTGFKPAFVMLKKSSQTSDWLICDSKRNTSNVVNKKLFPNTSGTEDSYDVSDFVSNGFKIRTTSGSINASGQTYIYMAFGQSLVGSNNVPCTAR